MSRDGYTESKSFTINDHTAIDELGDNAVKELRRIRHRLYRIRKKAPFEMRYAPSLVTRSEAELFGITMPRFALRAYLDEGKSSFINARRIALFAKAIHGWGDRKQESGTWKHCSTDEVSVEQDALAKNRTNPSSLIEDNWCIGDAVLVPPEDIKAQYHVLTVELGRAYGEGRDIYATPFMKHINYSGGGLCAQASCFMAASLLSSYAVRTRLHGMQSIHSVAEVSAIVADDDTNELPLIGLSPVEIIQYYERIGRTCYHEVPGIISTIFRFDTSEVFSKAVRAYILSGFPLILPVSINRMRQYIYGINRLSNDDSIDHCVVIIGCHKDKNIPHILFNDPAYSPFSQTTIQDIYNCARPLENENCSSRYLSVLPQDIRVSLLSKQVKDRYDYGLMEIIHCVEDNTKPPLLSSDHPLYHNNVQNNNIDEYCLARIGKIHNSYMYSKYQGLRSMFDDIEASLSGLKGRWVWMQLIRIGYPRKKGIIERFISKNNASDDYYESSTIIRIWDAEADIVDGAMDIVRNGSNKKEHAFILCDKLLLAATGTREHPKKMQVTSRLKILHEERNRRRLKLSLLSSFTVSGYPEAINYYKRKKLPCDLYIFMHNDIKQLCPGMVSKNKNPTLDIIQQLADRDKDIDDIAIKLKKDILDHAIPVIGFASFFPEIVSHDPTIAQHGLNALIFMLRLAHKLRALGGYNEQKGNPPFVIELVAGSRISGIWPAIITRQEQNIVEKGYYANRCNARVAIDRLCIQLSQAVQAVGSDINGICLAVEAEPGPLYVINNTHTMAYFCDKISNDSILSPYIGLSCDIAHWGLSGITPMMMYKDEMKSVLNRIVHMHVSDIGICHHGDAAPGELGLGHGKHSVAGERLDAFRGWLEIAKMRCEQTNHANYPQYSGYLSLELEACRGEDYVDMAVNRMNSMIHDMYSDD